MENWFEHLGIFQILFLSLAAFLAGFLDGIVGGGGLIQLPAVLVSLPDKPYPSIMGTNKISAILGNSVSLFRYGRSIKYRWGLIISMSICAAAFSYLGVKMIYLIDTFTMKKILLFVLIGIALFTFFKKDLGLSKKHHLGKTRIYIYALTISAVIGLYDGFIGPGTGSFLVLAFVTILGFDFLHASAYAKAVNWFTNFGALVSFFQAGQFFLGIALSMGFFNILGSFIGSGLALKNGNAFIKKIMGVSVLLLIFRFAYDLYFKS
jgi:uncharacterized protein